MKRYLPAAAFLLIFYWPLAYTNEPGETGSVDSLSSRPAALVSTDSINTVSAHTAVASAAFRNGLSATKRGTNSPGTFKESKANRAINNNAAETSLSGESTKGARL